MSCVAHRFWWAVIYSGMYVKLVAGRLGHATGVSICTSQLCGLRIDQMRALARRAEYCQVERSCGNVAVGNALHS